MPKYAKDEIVKILDADDEDGIGEEVWQCINCGAYAVSAESVKHHNGCKPGEAERWENFYEQANDEEV